MRVQLVVQYHNGITMFFPINFEEGWRIDASQRVITVGRGVPRKVIPLDTVAYFTIEEIENG